MKRIFLALRIDDITRALLSGLGGQVSGARPVADDQLHLTLRFIGDVDGATFLDIREQLWELSAKPILLSICGVGHFPPRGKPRILWAGVEPSGELIILRNKVNRILSLCNISPEQRKYHPHITLARLKTSSPHRVAQFLCQNSLLRTPAFTVDQLTLFSSILSPKGAVHTIEEEYPLLDQ
jgi:2'-5' RNA ligase